LTSGWASAPGPEVACLPGPPALLVAAGATDHGGVTATPSGLLLRYVWNPIVSAILRSPNCDPRKSGNVLALPVSLAGAI